jgi:hypothetical protein
MDAFEVATFKVVKVSVQRNATSIYRFSVSSIFKSSLERSSWLLTHYPAQLVSEE